MKKFLLGMASICVLGANVARASINVVDVKATQAAFSQVQMALKVANRINWKVGEFHKIELDTMFGKGDGSKTVTQDVPAQNALWYVTEINLMGQKQKTEALISREDGKLLKLIVNGEEQSVGSDDQIEIIDQHETNVTVPAGKFDCMYIKAKVTADGKTQELEAWINPVDVNLDGTLKMVIQTQMGPITLSLKEFGPKN
jgi:hypothetical protein